MTNEQLDKRRAERAGFRLSTKEEISEGCTVGWWWTYPNRMVKPSLPDFSHSTDVCFTWFKPVLILKLGFDEYCKFLKEWVDEFTLHDEEPAVAFCKAIDELILQEAG